MTENEMKEIEWMGSSKKDLLKFPLAVRKEMGHALYIAQVGGKYKYAKPLKGFGGVKILEICLDDRNGTYRTMYTVEFGDVVYVLDAFQKKSKEGIKTPKSDIDRVKDRYQAAQLKYQEKLKAKIKA